MAKKDFGACRGKFFGYFVNNRLESTNFLTQICWETFYVF